MATVEMRVYFPSLAMLQVLIERSTLKGLHRPNCLLASRKGYEPLACGQFKAISFMDVKFSQNNWSIANFSL